MSLSPETLLELMALSDGELTGKDKEKAEILVNSNAQAREVVETMRAGHIGAWLKESLVSRAVAAGADAISDTVVSRLSVAGASDRVPPPDRVRRRQRFASARIVFGFVSGGLALAAAVLLYVGQRRSFVGQPRVADLPAAPIDSTPASARTPPGLVGQVASSEGIVVDEIDSPSHSISLFEIASAVEPRHAASVVIWIEDEQGAK
jgi:hypothetical protein